MREVWEAENEKLWELIERAIAAYEKPDWEEGECQSEVYPDLLAAVAERDLAAEIEAAMPSHPSPAEEDAE